MELIRVDQWTREEDKLLADTVLSFISQQRSRLEAFGHVANQISRTAGACAYRWNTRVGKEHYAEIRKATKGAKFRRGSVTKKLDLTDQGLQLVRILVNREVNKIISHREAKGVTEPNETERELENILKDIRAIQD